METRNVVLAKDIMRPSVIAVCENTDVWELARIFSNKGISGAPVVDKEGCLLGLVSQTDLVRHLKRAAEEYAVIDFYSNPDEQSPIVGTATAKDLMSVNVITASESTTAEELSHIMLKRQIHRIIIVQGEMIKGIVTTMDLLKVL